MGAPFILSRVCDWLWLTPAHVLQSWRGLMGWGRIVAEGVLWMTFERIDYFQ